MSSGFMRFRERFTTFREEVDIWKSDGQRKSVVAAIVSGRSSTMLLLRECDSLSYARAAYCALSGLGMPRHVKISQRHLRIPIPLIPAGKSR
uniref:Uncharacterized protein n=1 Tax=Trichogramma kaykai TaxID=54128 RepID=A0ABD2WZS2_9HYME